MAIQELKGLWAAAVSHEIGHSIGFYHEHCRSDRNQFIEIKWDNIKNNRRSNYEQEPYSEIMEVLGMNYTSVMMYPSYNSDAIDPDKPVMVRSYTGRNYSAHIPSLPGCVSVGDTLDEIKANMKEAVEFHIEGCIADGFPIPDAFRGPYGLVFKLSAEL